MFNSDTELMFPMRVAASLRDARGVQWAQLIDAVTSQQADLLDQSAFVLMMVKMGGCVACNSAEQIRSLSSNTTSTTVILPILPGKVNDYLNIG